MTKFGEHGKFCDILKAIVVQRRLFLGSSKFLRLKYLRHARTHARHCCASTFFMEIGKLFFICL